MRLEKDRRMFDLEAMRSISKQLFSHRIEQVYGPAGSTALRRLLEAVNRTHKEIPFENMTRGLTVIAPLDPATDPIELEGGIEVMPGDLAVRFRGTGTVQALPGGRLRFWPTLIDEFTELWRDSVIYHFHGGDYFVIEGALAEVPNPTGFPSVFGLPTFVELEAALGFYANQLVRYSTCKILRTCWHGNGRILLKNKPEEVMRESLTQYLRSTLRNQEIVEVREEQNMDESKPVDIKVTWSLSNRMAIIEIKWLGSSVNSKGTRVSTVYTESRALEGALQLANYLEDNRERSPLHVTKGYLVVFDARRRGLGSRNIVDSLSDANAEYYADLEIAYDPQYETRRSDFASPSRFFMAVRNLNAG